MTIQTIKEQLQKYTSLEIADMEDGSIKIISKTPEPIYEWKQDIEFNPTQLEHIIEWIKETYGKNNRYKIEITNQGKQIKIWRIS